MSGTNNLTSGVTYPISAFPVGLLNDGYSFTPVVVASGNGQTLVNGINLVMYSGQVVVVPAALSAQTHLLKVSDWSGYGAATISGAAGVTINGASSKAITTAYQTVNLFCSGDSNYRTV